MSDFPYGWVLVLIAVACVFSVVTHAIRFASTGGKPSHGVGMMLYGVLAIISGWVAWLTFAGPPFP